MEKMEQRISSIGLGILVLFISIVSFFCMPVQAKTWNVRMATYFGSDHAASIALREVFVPMVAKETNDRVKVNVFDNCQLGAEKELTENLRANTIEMAIFGNMLENTLPKLQILQQPFVFRNVNHLLKVINGPVGEDLLSDFSKVNVKPLSGFSQGAVHLGNKIRPIHTLEDCKGMRMRVWQGKSIIETMKSFGIAPTALALTETYTALQQGIVDGVPNSILNYKNMGWGDQVKYISKMPCIIFPNYYVANKKWFEKLPEDVQQAIQRSAVAAANRTIEILDEQEAKTEKWFKEKYQVQIIQLTDQEIEPFRKAAKCVLDDFCKKYNWAEDMLVRINNVK